MIPSPGCRARRRIPFTAIRFFPELRADDKRLIQIFGILNDRGHDQDRACGAGSDVEILNTASSPYGNAVLRR